MNSTNSLPIQGFYTEEVRENRSRIGFDIVGFQGARCPLARISECDVMDKRQPKVGKYAVLLQSFETVALPLITVDIGLVVVDEIGKMELFSSHFKQQVTKLLNNSKVTLFGTIPIYRSISFVENIRHRSDVKVIEITLQNRNDENLVNEIANELASIQKKT